MGTELSSLLTAVLGLAVILGLWFGVQEIVRRRSSCGSDHDLLEGHSCAGCTGNHACRNRKEHVTEREHHELV